MSFDSKFSQLEFLTQLLVLANTGIAGMLAHWVKKWIKKEVEGNLLDYLLRDHPRDTLLMLFGLFGALGAAFFAGQFDALTIKQLFVPVFLIGYASDSVLNRGSSPATA